MTGLAERILSSFPSPVCVKASGTGGESADEVMYRPGGFPEINEAVLFGNLLCVGGKRIVLRGTGRGAVLQVLNGIEEGERARRAELVVDDLKVVVVLNRDLGLHEHITRVKPFCHVHDGHARHAFAVHDRALHGAARGIWGAGNRGR